MTRRLTALTLDTLSDLPEACRRCVFWELDAVAARQAEESGDTALEKEAWLSDTLLQWGGCGQVAYLDGEPAGFVMYAPPAYVPRAVGFATSPVGPDAVLLMTARLRPQFAGSGLGRVLVQAAVRDLHTRGIRAVEAFGTTRSDERSAPCLLPADYLLSVGFKTVRPHPRTPRLRLDIRSTVSWREGVEAALERWLGERRNARVPALARYSRS